MKCAICSRPANRVLICSKCHKPASYLCDGFLCRPALWARKEHEPRSVIPLMNMECEHCAGQLVLTLLSVSPRPRFQPRLETIPEEPETPISIFPTTTVKVRNTFFKKKIVVVTNVFGDGLGDLGQGAKLARQLREMGAEVTFVVCCLTTDKQAIERTLGNDVGQAIILSGPVDFASQDRNPIPIAKVSPGKEVRVISAANAAHLVLSFPTKSQLAKEELQDQSKYMLIEECVQLGQHILGFGLTGAPLNTEQAKRKRLGVLLNNMGPCAQVNIEQLQNPNLQSLLLHGMQIKEWRAATVFSVGYVKVPEGKVSLVSPSPFGLKNTHSSSSLKFGTKGMLPRPLMMEMEMPSPSGMMSVGMKSGLNSKSPLDKPLMMGMGKPKSSSSGGVKNAFMDNYITLMCISTLADDSVTSVTLYCPNFAPDSSQLEWAQVEAKGGFIRHAGKISGRTVFVVSGNAGQDDFHKLLNEAALHGELRKRPLLVGAAGEGSLSEVLSIQSTQAVFPIYSPRYPYQKDNLLRLALECQDKLLLTILERIMNLHEESNLLELWKMILETQKSMWIAKQVVHEQYNFLNLLCLRMEDKL